MADITALRNRIQAAIKQNGNQEITGPVLQTILLDIADVLNGIISSETDLRENADGLINAAILSEAQTRANRDNSIEQSVTSLGQRLTLEITEERRKAEAAFNGLNLIDAAGSQLQPTQITLTLNKNDGSEEDPDWRTLTELVLPSATTLRAGLLSADDKQKIIAFAASLVNVTNLVYVSTVEGYPRTNRTMSGGSAYTSNVFNVSNLDKIYISGTCDSNPTAFDAIALVAFSTDSTFATFTHGFVRQPALGQELNKYEVSVPEHASALYACVLNRFAVASANGYISAVDINDVRREVNNEKERAEAAFNGLNLIDAAGSQLQSTQITLCLRKNDGTEQDPDWRTLTELVLPSATTLRAGLLSADDKQKIIAFAAALMNTTNLDYSSTVEGYPRTNGVIQSGSTYLSGIYDISELDKIYISGTCDSNPTAFDAIALVAFSTDSTFATFTHGFVRQPALGQELNRYEVSVPEHTGVLYACVLNRFAVASADGYVNAIDINDAQREINTALNNLDLSDITSSELQSAQITLCLRKNDGTEQDPDWRTLTELVLPSASTLRAGLLSADDKQRIDTCNSLLLKSSAISINSTVEGYPRTNRTMSGGSAYTSNVFNVSNLDKIYISGTCDSNSTAFNAIALVAFSTDPTFATFTHGFVRQPALGQELIKFEVSVPEHDGTLYACVLNRFMAFREDGYVDVEKIDSDVKNINNSLKTLQELNGNIIVGYPRNNGRIFGDVYRSKVYNVSNTSKLYISGTENAPQAVLLVAFSTDPTFNSYTHGSVAQPDGYTELTDYEVQVPEHILGQTLYACIPYKTGENGDYVFNEVKGSNIFNAQDVIDELEEHDRRINALEQDINPTKIINCIGDSITQGQSGILNLREGTTTSWNRYPYYLQNYLGNSYSVKNYGYGGNTPADILSAMGWQGVILNQQVILKGDQTPAAINSQEPLTESYSDNNITGYLSQLRTDEARAAQTKCHVFGTPCNISRSSNVLYIARQEAVSYDDTLPVGTMISMDGVLDKDAVNIIFVGENNINYYQSSNFVEYIKNTVSKIQNNKYIIIGLHVAANQLSVINDIKTANAALRKEFGNRFIDLQKEMSCYAIFNALGYTPTDDNYFTQEQLTGGVYSDVSAISLGIQPSSFWREVKGIADFTGNDSVHMSGLGYQALAYLIYKRIQTLGWL